MAAEDIDVNPFPTLNPFPHPFIDIKIRLD
jgi:hypothetical protein